MRFQIRDQKGLTLIELIIVSALFVLLGAIVVPSIGAITGAQLKSTASKLAGTLRYTYDLAVRKNQPFRVVLDLNEQAYWVESSSDRFLLSREKSGIRNGSVEEPDEDERTQSRFITRGYIESGEMWKPKKSASFANFKGPLTEKISLPEHITFQGAWVAHQKDRATSGLVYIYSFPTGMTEQALIHLAEDDQDVFTLQVWPLTGTVKIFPYYLDEPES